MIEPPAEILRALADEIVWRTRDGDDRATVARLAIRETWDVAANYYGGGPLDVQAEPTMPTRLAGAVRAGHDMRTAGATGEWRCAQCGATATLENGEPAGNATKYDCGEGRHHEDPRD